MWNHWCSSLYILMLDYCGMYFLFLFFGIKLKLPRRFEMFSINFVCVHVCSMDLAVSLIKLNLIELKLN